MSEKFLHGVEIIEKTVGARPIRTVKSSVIGIVGTAPNAAAAIAATLLTGSVVLNTGLTITADAAGTTGNAISVQFVDPGAVSQALSVAVSGNAITVNLATDVSGVITSTAADVLAAINGDGEAGALVTATHTTGSDGTGAVSAFAAKKATGGKAEPFPLNIPTLVVGSRAVADELGSTGSLPPAMDDIFDQTGALVVVVRVADDADPATEKANVIGGVSGGNYTGIHALEVAESVVGVRPRILVAPEYSDDAAVIAELAVVAGPLGAMAYCDGPNSTDSAAIQVAENTGSDRVYVIDPNVTVFDTTAQQDVDRPASARIAGLRAKIDNDEGFWVSISNHNILGIIGTSRKIQFSIGDANSQANLLNEGNIGAIIRSNGYKAWGNRTTSGEFECVRRTKDMINDSVQRAMIWAVDRGITATLVEEVTDSVNSYLRSLKAQGAILGGTAWPDPDLNTPENVAQGKLYINFDFTPAYPAEHIIFTSIVTNDYVKEVFSQAA